MSLRPSSRAEQRRKSSKKTIDADEARKKREEVSIEIRKSKREEQEGGGRAVVGWGWSVGDDGVSGNPRREIRFGCV